MSTDRPKEYVQVRTPDKNAIADLVMRAKGPDRTMAQFAEVCDLSASTLSRIVNGKITKPLTMEAILKIYEHHANGKHEAFLDQLASVNGMMGKEAHERISARSRTFSERNADMDREVKMKNLIMNELFDRGIPVLRPKYTYRMKDGTHASSIFPGRLGDFALTFSENGREHVWSFFWFPEVTIVETASPATRILQSIMRKLACWFLLDAWEPNSLRNLKTSFVFADRTIFEGFLEMLHTASLRNEMSAILVDPDCMAVIKEVWLPGSFDKPDESVFERPKIESLEEFGDETDFIAVEEEDPFT